MLQWLDTLIGLVVILLGVSLIIMMLTQIVSGFFNLRGFNLLRGIRVLLETTDPTFKLTGKYIGQKVLRHPFISDGRSFFKWRRCASTIRPDELVNILRMLTREPPQVENKGKKPIWRKLPRKLRSIFEKSPGETQWHDHLKSNILKIEDNIERWMDRIMERTSQHFNRDTRYLTITFSLLVAFAMHLDAFQLFKQISSDSELRAKLTANTEFVLKQVEAVVQTEAAQKSFSLLKTEIDSVSTKLDRMGFKLIPDSKHKCKLPTTLSLNIPTGTSYYADLLGDRHFWGVLVMAALLSLGAPFWFNTLRTLSSLRPHLAGKEEKEKELRATHLSPK